MSQLTIGMGAMAVSSDPEDVLITYALGSCVAVIVHDPVRKVAGMLHFMLPISAQSRSKAEENPAMFADTGVPLLFESMYEKGSHKRDLVVRLAGGAKVGVDSAMFDIGRRNCVAVRKMLWTAGVPIAAEDVGGSNARTARIVVATGVTSIRSRGQELEL